MNCDKLYRLYETTLFMKKKNPVFAYGICGFFETPALTGVVISLSYLFEHGFDDLFSCLAVFLIHGTYVPCDCLILRICPVELPVVHPYGRVVLVRVDLKVSYSP